LIWVLIYHKLQKKNQGINDISLLSICFLETVWNLPFILFCVFFNPVAVKLPKIAKAIRVSFALSEQKILQKKSKKQNQNNLLV
jgi:hypothetical protein